MVSSANAISEPLDGRISMHQSNGDAVFLDGKPLGVVFRDYRAELYAFLLKKTDHPADAEDILSETFLKIARAYCQFRGGVLRAWLYRIAKNTFFSHCRLQQLASL